MMGCKVDGGEGPIDCSERARRAFKRQQLKEMKKVKSAEKQAAKTTQQGKRHRKAAEAG